MRILLIALTKDFLRAQRPKKPKGTIFLRFPSLALANIAALTPKEHQIFIADEQISPIDYSINVDLVAISVNTSVALRAYAIAAEFRKRKIKVVFGGLHPSLLPKESAKYADAIIIGDADGVWQQVVADACKGRLKKQYVNTQHLPLDTLPTPAYDVFKGMGYVSTNFVETSRGCPHDCKFCSTAPFYQHRHRVRPIADILRDIKAVRSFPKRFIFFVDDNIIADREHAKALFKALIPLKIVWISQATVDIGDDEELVRLAAQSGCFGLFLGFESIAQQDLQEAGKKHNRIERYRKTVDLLHKYGIGIEAGFIFGFDHDDPSIFQRTYDFLTDSRIDSFLAIYLTPIPGTGLYDQLKRQKRLITDDYAKYDFRHVVFKPKGMTPEQLYDGVSWITMRFYSPRPIARRFWHRLKIFARQPSIRTLIAVVGLLAISLGFRKRIKDLSADGTFPREYRKL